MSSLPFRIGHGYDVHALGEGLELWLGGVRIPHTKGCIAHSDGDVAIHALCDAMLGALALGDIGQHFPDTSEEYRGIDSKILLQKVDALVRSHGYAVSNADITIAAQRPKLAPYIVRMRQTLADILGVDISQVSVKATTTEHLGFTGREEGIAVWASVLLPATAKRARCVRCGRPLRRRGRGGWRRRARGLLCAGPGSGAGTPRG